MAKLKKEDPSKALLASMDFGKKKQNKTEIVTKAENNKKVQKKTPVKTKISSLPSKEKSLSKQLSITLFSKDLDVIQDTTDIIWQNNHLRTTTSDVIKVALRLMPKDNETILKTYRDIKKEDGRRK